MYKGPSRYCDEFIQRLSSSAPTPGGGAAAAMCGALAASLGTMAGNIRFDKLKTPEERSLFHSTYLKACDRLHVRYRMLMDDDEQAYRALRQCYGIPKSDPSRDERIYIASLAAAQPPMRMLRSALEVVEALEKLLPHVGRMLISDIACGASLAAATMETAALNIFVNTAAYQDRPDAKLMQEEAEKLLAEGLPRARALHERLLREVKGE